MNDELDLWDETSLPSVVGERVRLCRLALGWKTIKLANKLDVSTSAVNYWESGDRQPVNNLQDLCQTLEVSPTGLATDAPPLPSSGPFFRSALKKESVRLREQTTAYARLVADMATYLQRRVGLSISGEHLSRPFTTGNPTVPARELRRRLSAPIGPIDNMIRAAEAAGAIAAFGVPPARVGIENVKSVDAYSVVVGRWPVIVMTSRGDYYRQRWDVAHELGHLVLHQGNLGADEEMEREANQFAAEFLLPAEEVIAELPTGASRSQDLITTLSGLKEHWGVSYRALLRRARELDRMSETTFRRASQMLNDRGWRQREPGKMQTLEMPNTLPDALDRYLGYGVDRDLVLEEVGIPRLLFEFIVSRYPVDVPRQTQEL